MHFTKFVAAAILVTSVSAAPLAITDDILRVVKSGLRKVYKGPAVPIDPISKFHYLSSLKQAGAISKADDVVLTKMTASLQKQAAESGPLGEMAKKALDNPGDLGVLSRLKIDGKIVDGVTQAPKTSWLAANPKKAVALAAGGGIVVGAAVDDDDDDDDGVVVDDEDSVPVNLGYASEQIGG